MSTPDSRFDLWSEEARTNPLALYKRLRQEAPIVRLHNPNHDAPMWVVSRYADSVEFLRDARFTKDKHKLSEKARGLYFRVGELGQLDQHMLSVDPPAHTRLRALVNKAFTARRVEGLRPRITAIAHRLLDAVQPHGRMDLLEDFAYPLPITVIAEMLGIPPEDHGRFREWTNAVFAPPVGNLEAVRRMAVEFHQYLQGFLARRRAEPRDDLTSALIAAEEQGEQLNAGQLMSMLFLLIVAGHETTVNLIGNGIWALLRHPEQLERLRADPSISEPAVEELLRYCGPQRNSTSRFAVEDTEFLGQVIPAGELIVTLLVAANHDADQFPEPERLDLTREPNRHIAFGYGPHFCLGAPLARLEASIAFNILLERLPRLRFAEAPSTLRWRTGMIIHGLERLPVAF